MKMTRTLLLLLTLIPLGTSASTSTIESIDVVLDSLNFVMPKGASGSAGDLRFRSLDLYSTELFINLYDDGDVFDSQMYLRPDFFGISGKNHAIGLNFDTSGFAGIHTVDLNTSSISFNKKQISIDSKEFALAYQEMNVEADNFKFFCKKHPDFPGNDIQALKYGCLSDSSFIPLEEGEPISISATIREIDDSGSSVKVSTDITSVKFKTKRIFMAADKTEFTLDESIKLNVDHMALTCKKNSDIEKFDPNKLIYDCIDDVALEVRGLSFVSSSETAEGKTEELKIITNHPSIILDEKIVSMKTDEIDILLESIKIHGTNIHLSCDKSREGISNNDINALVMTCLDTSNIKEMNGKYAEFNIKMENETVGNIEIDANLKAIDMTNGDFSTEVGYTTVNVGNEIFAGTHGIKLKCESNFELPREINADSIENINFDESLNSCLTTLEIPQTEIFLSNVNRDGRYFLEIARVTVQEDSVDIDIPAIQLVSNEGSNTILDLKGRCSKQNEIMPYDYSEMIVECLKDGNFYMSTIINDEDNKKVKNIMSIYDEMERASGRDINPVDLVKDISPSLKHLNITSKDNDVILKVEMKIFGITKDATIEAKAHFDKVTEKLVLKVTKTDLPFGISSRRFSLLIIKQIIADDRLNISASNKTITIDLKF